MSDDNMENNPVWDLVDRLRADLAAATAQRDEALDRLAKVTEERDAYRAVAMAAGRWRHRWNIWGEAMAHPDAALIDAVDAARAAGLLEDGP